MQNCSIKFVLRKSKAKANGQIPIYLRITITPNSSFIATNHTTLEKDWNDVDQVVRVSHQMHKHVNPDLHNLKSRAIVRLTQLQVSELSFTSEDIKDFITGKRVINHHNIFEFLPEFVDSVRDKRAEGTIDNYFKHLKKLEQFHGSKNLTFEEVNVAYLAKYEAWLYKSIDHRGDSKNYIHSLFKTLKVIFNAARKRDIITNYPFSKYENPVYRAPEKDFLTEEELQLWEIHADTFQQSTIKKTALYFLLGCLTGLRISDWFLFDQKKHIIDDRLVIKPFKTRAMGRWVDLPVTPRVKRLLAKIKDLPLDIEEPTINEKLKIIALSLGIKKRITTHSGRHTFAVTICLGNDMSSEASAKYMGITLQVFLKNYSQIIQSKLNREAERAWKHMV